MFFEVNFSNNRDLLAARAQNCIEHTIMTFIRFTLMLLWRRTFSLKINQWKSSWAQISINTSIHRSLSSPMQTLQYSIRRPLHFAHADSRQAQTEQNKNRTIFIRQQSAHYVTTTPTQSYLSSNNAWNREKKINRTSSKHPPHTMAYNSNTQHSSTAPHTNALWKCHQTNCSDDMEKRLKCQEKEKKPRSHHIFCCETSCAKLNKIPLVETTECISCLGIAISI